MGSSKEHRIVYFDFLRGLAILMVVGIHTYTVEPYDGALNISKAIMRDMLDFAVPLFLAISGYFLGERSLQNKFEYLSFIKKQIPRVYIPAVLWSIPMMFLMLYQGHNIIGVFGRGLLCMTFVPYYFILLIVQFYILLPLLQKLSAYKWGWGVVWGINIIGLILLPKMFQIEGLPFAVYVSPFIYWIVFYYLGVYLANRNRDYTIYCPLIIIVAGLVMTIIENIFIKRGVVGISISTWIYSFGMILLFFSSKVEKSIKRGVMFNSISFIGRISFGIYLTHVYFMWLIERYLNIDLWCLLILLLASSSILFTLCLQKVLPSSIGKWLGLK